MAYLALAGIFVVVVVLAAVLFRGGYGSPEEPEPLQNYYSGEFEQVGVPKEEHRDCMAWAFGENWATMTRSDSADKWNETHADIFIIKGHERITDTLLEIGKAYLEKRQR